MRWFTKLPIAIASSIMLFTWPAMSQPKCGFFRIAHDIVAREFEITDLSYRHSVISESDTVWTVRHELPPDWIGFVPVVGVDKRTCVVVHSDMEW